MKTTVALRIGVADAECAMRLLWNARSVSRGENRIVLGRIIRSLKDGLTAHRAVESKRVKA
jgi:hypothetical protein